MIDQVYKTLQTIVNKEQDGYVSPEEFNDLSKQVQDNIFRSYFEDHNRDKNKENRGLTNESYGNLVHNQEERINQFSVTTTIAQAGGVYPLPSDLYFIEDYGIITSTNKVVDKLVKSKVGYLNNSISGPTDTYPVYERMPSNVTIYPNTITGDITIRYVRQPLDPKWTYTEVAGDPLYNPSALDHQDFELHPSEFPNIVLEMLTYFGINLREGEVIQVAEQLKNTLMQKDNN